MLGHAALACLAFAANDSPVASDPAGAKDVAAAFAEALKEEKPALKEEEELHASAVKAHVGVSKDDLVAALTNPGGWASEFEKDVMDLVIGLSKETEFKSVCASQL